LNFSHQERATVPTTPFLRNEAFDPKTVEAMSQAFAEVRRALELSDAADQMAGLVARRIIELAQSGIRTKAALVMRTMQELKAKRH
jgi:hypothetical protein